MKLQTFHHEISKILNLFDFYKNALFKRRKIALESLKYFFFIKKNLEVEIREKRQSIL